MLQNEKILIYKNIDVKMDIFNSNFEKELKRLPSGLKFIKKIIYMDLLPKVDRLIEDLENIKSTPNYDDNLCSIRPNSLSKLSQVSCIDLFETNNLKRMNSQRMVYGTYNGTVGIFDIESSKIITEKAIVTNSKQRVDVLASSTIKYYDTYLSRIALQLRGDSNLHVLNFNHSFPHINVECVINLKEGLQSDPNININTLISSIKFSRDTFYLTLTDYSGGIRVYKFKDVPLTQNSNVKEPSLIKKDSTALQFNFSQSKISDKKQEIKDLSLPELIQYVQYKEPENFTIITVKPEETSGKDKKPNINKQQTVVKKQDIKSNKNEKNISNASLLEGAFYNINSSFDEKTSFDSTPLQKFSKNSPIITFVQKKLIEEDKNSGNFSSSLLTVGVYITFYGTNTFKFISLFPYLTENMKNAIKIVKSKGNVISEEESVAMSSSIMKKEKEYISFIKSKLDNMNQIINEIPTKDVKGTKPKLEKIEVNIKDITKSEMNFTTLFPISCMSGLSCYSSRQSSLAIGMKDGSVLLWDTELHTDRDIFVTNTSHIEVVSVSMDDNHIVAGLLDGVITIYDIGKKTLVYKSFHYPYMNYPVRNILPVFPMINLVIDHEQNIRLYNTKESSKAGRIILETNQKTYSVDYLNKFLFSCNDEYLIFVTSKEKAQKVKKNLLDLIKFQKQSDKSVLEGYDTPCNNYSDFFQEKYSNSILPIKSKSYLLIFKIKDILLKCYPQLIMHHKKGYSLNKLMKKYDINNIPTLEKEEKRISTLFGTKEKKPILFRKSLLVEIAENENETIDNSTRKDPNSPRKKSTLALENDLNIMKNDLKPLEDKKAMTLEDLNIEQKVKIDIEKMQTEKKNIFYLSIKNIKERYQYKDQRMNRIQARNERIVKELTLPVIKTKIFKK